MDCNGSAPNVSVNCRIVKYVVSTFPGSWRAYGAPSGFLESLLPILVPLRLRGIDLWSETQGEFDVLSMVALPEQKMNYNGI